MKYLFGIVVFACLASLVTMAYPTGPDSQVFELGAEEVVGGKSNGMLINKSEF